MEKKKKKKKKKINMKIKDQNYYILKKPKVQKKLKGFTVIWSPM
jgi:hypothetical protein